MQENPNPRALVEELVQLHKKELKGLQARRLCLRVWGLVSWGVGVCFRASACAFTAGAESLQAYPAEQIRVWKEVMSYNDPWRYATML